MTFIKKCDNNDKTMLQVHANRFSANQPELICHEATLG